MRSFPCFIAIFIFLTSCSSLFIPAGEKYSDFLPVNSDVPGWFKFKNILPKNKVIHKKSGIISNAGIMYKNKSDNIISVEIIKFNNRLNSYGYFSKIRGYGSCKNSKCNYYFEGKNITAHLSGEVLVIIKNPIKQEVSRNTRRIFLDSVRMDKVLETPKTINTISKIINFNDNLIIYSPVVLNKFKKIDNIYYTKIDNIVIFISNRESKIKAFNLYNNIIKNNGFIIIESNDSFRAFKSISKNSKQYISLYENWLIGSFEYQDEIKLHKYIGQVIKNIKEDFGTDL